MRVSADPQDPGYSPGLVGRVDVYLDDEKQRDAVTADEEEGLVVIYARDEAGRLRVEGDELVTKTLRGKVRIGVHHADKFITKGEWT
ncbi:hypothetical protein [Pseudomonas rhizoryzae]|uniref:hypothetical protein n=1 Tax=Pseudomonas rhizoryzae TaxID=2571129 RepID=UPI0010C226CC|nr:hypothetical protein [Pseudomonas rhizoryzae]